MEERQKIQAELERMREECVRDYLEEKLQQITSKEVIHDILQEFLQANNQQFLSSIADNIQEAKQQNRALKSQIQTLKEQAEQRLQQATEAIHQECQQMLMQEVSTVRRQSEVDSAQLRGQIEDLQHKNLTLRQQRQQLLASLRSKDQEALERDNLKTELAQSKRSFMNFKESCERIIYQGNRDKEREKQKMIDEWNQVKEQLESQIKNQHASEALKEELLIQRQKVERKDQEILQLGKALQESNLKLDEINELYSQLSFKYEQIKENESAIITQMADLTRVVESNELSLNYLKEENNYLREEIQSFSSRYQSLERQKSALSRQANEYKRNLTKRTEEYESMLQRQKQQFTTTMTEYKGKYESDISEMLGELSKMKEEIQNYSHEISQKENSLVTLTQQNNDLVQAKLSLQEEVNNRTSSIEMHEMEVQQYQAELINVKQQCRVEVESLKQTFEANWNSKNEQVIEQQFINHQLKEQIVQLNTTISQLKEEIDSLHYNISVKDEKEQYYKLVTQEIKALKKKFSPQRSDQSLKDNIRLSHRFMGNESKLYFITRQMQKEISLLKQSNEELRGFALRSIGQISTYIQQSTAFILARFNTSLPRPQEPLHHVSLKKNVQLKLLIRDKEFSYSKQEKSLDKKDEIFNRTVQQRVNTQPSNNFTQIKKTLKNIQQRYQSVQQENKFYSTHIDSFIRQA